MKIALLDSFTTLLFSGAKAQEFLQGQFTCDMRQLNSHGDCSLAACCDHRGRMLANFWVIRWRQDFLVIVPKSVGTLLQTHLQKYAVFSKVVITQKDDFLTDVSDQWSVIDDRLPINTDENSWRKHNIENEFAILCDKTTLLFTPAMINWDKLGGVSFDKGCYVGQEIVARTHYLGTVKRHVRRLQLDNAHGLNPGDSVKNANGESIGVIVDAMLIDKNTYDVLAVMQD